MGEADFRQDLTCAARRNGIQFLNEDKVMSAVADDVRGGARLVTVHRGSAKNELLVVTDRATHAVRLTMFGSRRLWSIRHGDANDVGTGRRVHRGHVVDLVWLETRGGDQKDFWLAFTDRRLGVNLKMAEEKAESAARDIVGVLRGGGRKELPQTSLSAAPAGVFDFDPEGPEKAGHAGQESYGRQDWPAALQHFVTAVDRLHDFYAFEQFMNRQPSPRDAWLVNGLVSALGVTRNQRQDVDVTELVRTATHRLRTITTAVEGAGADATLYRRGLDGIAQYAPDVDVSDVFW